MSAQHPHRGHRLRRYMTHTQWKMVEEKPRNIIKVMGASRPYQHNSENCVSRQRRSMRHISLEAYNPRGLIELLVDKSVVFVRLIHSTALHSLSGDSKVGTIHESLKHCSSRSMASTTTAHLQILLSVRFFDGVAVLVSIHQLLCSCCCEPVPLYVYPIFTQFSLRIHFSSTALHICLRF